MQAWIAEELRGVDLNDKRLDKRLAIILDHLSEQPSASIPTACGGLAETLAAYRFFDNAKVSPEKLLAPHVGATTRRAAAQPVVLVAQDTTELDWTREKEEVGGPLRDERQLGAHVHCCLAMTPDRVPLGVIRGEAWARDASEFGKRLDAANKPIEAKESYRWLQGYEASCELAERCPETQVICLSDSEGDIDECFEEASREQEGRRADWIVRACQDRRLTDPQGRKLYEAAGAAPAFGVATIQVSAREKQTGDGSRRRGKRTARETEVTFRATTVVLKKPGRRGHAKRELSDLRVNVVLVREECGAPEGEPPIEQVLLTSLPIDTPEAVRRVVEYYACRWEVEVYFRILKSGCRVEKRQLETTDRMLACLTVYLIVAWRVAFLTMLGRECPALPCDAVLDDSEWRAVWVLRHGGEPPKQAPPLGEMVRMIAALGGYLGRKGDGPPGAKAMWIGIQRMRDFALAWHAFRPQQPSCV